jgi:hypothetical protein
MKGFALSFAKSVFFILLCAFCLLGRSEAPFSVAAPLPVNSPTPPPGSQTPPEDTSTELLARLKQDAVILWLRQYLGSKASSVEKMVTPDFAENYILDYKLSRSGANKEIIQLSGHLDDEALKGWVRLSETKGKGSNQIRPLLIISANLPGMSTPSVDYFTHTGNSTFSQQVTQMVNQEVQKFNLRAIPASGAVGSTPPRNEREIVGLREGSTQDGANTAIWVYLNQCKSCEFPRLDIYLYSFMNPRLLSVQSDDLNIAVKDLGNTEKLKAALLPIFNEFHQEFERVIAEGKLNSAPLTVTIEGIDNYLSYRKIEYSLSKQSYLGQIVPHAFVQNTAQFEAVSSLGAEEVARRIQESVQPEIKLSPIRVDSRNIVMRYSR